MKIRYLYSPILLGLLLVSCGRSVQPSSEIYNLASTRHYELTQGNIPASDQEWLALIEQFQRVIDADANGEWADDAQYAIASCWLWLESSAEETSIDHAIDAFQKLLRDYPDSPHAAEAHYWLGYCYSFRGDENQAAAHYQMVISRYLSHPIADKAQLQLGRAYELQHYFTSALATYEALCQRSQNSQIIAQARQRMAYIQSRPAEAPKPVNLPMKTVQKEPPHVAPSASADSSETPVSSPVAVVEHPSPEPLETARPVPNPSLVQQLGLNVKTIVIDPGHGGKDPGTVSRTGQEKRIVLSLSRTLRDLLAEKGYQVRLTRDTDVYIPLKARTQFATRHDADLFISIHINASPNVDATGIETYYLALASDEAARITAMRENLGTKYSIKELDVLVAQILKESKSTESRRLAESIQSQLVHSMQAKDRGVKHAPFVVLIGTKVPAILIEVGFLSNPEEAKKLATKTYQRQLAEAIIEGVEQYVRNVPVAIANRP